MALTDKYLTEHEIYDDIIITDAILKEEPLTKEQAHTIYPYLKKTYRHNRYIICSSSKTSIQI